MAWCIQFLQINLQKFSKNEQNFRNEILDMISWLEN